MSDFDPNAGQETGDIYEGLSDFGRRYVEQAPEDQRALIAEHYRKWDEGYQKKMGEVEQQLNSYRQYGEPEHIQEMTRAIQLLQNNPVEVFKRFYEIGAISDDQLTFLQRQQAQNEQEGGEGLDPKLEQRLQKMLEEKLDPLQRGLGASATWIQQQEERRKQEEENRNLDEHLKGLHQTHGDFDDEFVLALMQNGIKDEEAIKLWNQKIDEAIKARQAPRPPNVMGAGGPSTGKKDFSSMNREQTVNFLAEALRAQRGSQ